MLLAGDEMQSKATMPGTSDCLKPQEALRNLSEARTASLPLCLILFLFYFNIIKTLQARISNAFDKD